LPIGRFFKSKSLGGNRVTLVVLWHNKAMTSDDFIKDAIDRGQRNGLKSLDQTQRLVYLIAEAEADCVINGIDTFLDRYAPDWIAETANAFLAVGASEIADELRKAPVDALFSGDPRLNRLNDLICDHVGYDYDAIKRIVEERPRTIACS
jgi:hypothetical protein